MMGTLFLALRPVCAACLALLAAPWFARADEVRQFQVLIDGKQAGNYQLRIAAVPDGRTTVTATADVRARFGLFSYTYALRCQEVWNGDRLESVQSTSVDDGKKTTVSAVIKDGRSKITVNGRPRTDGPLAWTTVEWQLPAVPSGKRLTVLDVDVGKSWIGPLRYVDDDDLNLIDDEDEKHCTHYHLDGDSPADVWFDRARRLVRQVTVEDGHRIEIRLSRLTR